MRMQDLNLVLIIKLVSGKLRKDQLYLACNFIFYYVVISDNFDHYFQGQVCLG